MSRLGPARFCARLATMVATLLLTVGCSTQEEGRLAIGGQVTLDGRTPAAGTLILTPMSPGQAPVTTRVDQGAFAFTSTTGPYPGRYEARLNRDEPAIEEIIEIAQVDPTRASRQFHVHATAPSHGRQSKPAITAVEITPQSTSLSIELTTSPSQP